MAGEAVVNWYGDRDRHMNTPSRQRGMSLEKEEASLQSVSTFLIEICKRLNLTRLCRNTAILYTQRFYMYHPMQIFERFSLAASALLLASKVEEQPRKIETIVSVARSLGCFDKSIKDAAYVKDIEFNENVLMSTLISKLTVVHPHAKIVKICERLKLDIPVSAHAYIYATYSLQLTRMCTLYEPYTIACFCLLMGSSWNGITIPPHEGKPWYNLEDDSLTEAKLDQLCKEFLEVIISSPDKYKHGALISNPTQIVEKLLSRPASGSPSASGRIWTHKLNELHEKMKKMAQIQNMQRTRAPNTPPTSYHLQGLLSEPSSVEKIQSSVEDVVKPDPSPRPLPPSSIPSNSSKTQPATLETIPCKQTNNDPTKVASYSSGTVHTQTKQGPTKTSSPTVVPNTTFNFAPKVKKPVSTNVAVTAISKKMASGRPSITPATKAVISRHSSSQVPWSDFKAKSGQMSSKFPATTGRPSANPTTPINHANLINVNIVPSDQLFKKLPSPAKIPETYNASNWDFSGLNKLHKSENATVDKNPDPMPDYSEPLGFGDSFPTVSWGPPPASTESFKISIPKIRVQDIISATHDDAKTDKAKRFKVPNTVSFGGALAGPFAQPKRFKPNTEE